MRPCDFDQWIRDSGVNPILFPAIRRAVIDRFREIYARRTRSSSRQSRTQLIDVFRGTAWEQKVEAIETALRGRFAAGAGPISGSPSSGGAA